MPDEADRAHNERSAPKRALGILGADPLLTISLIYLLCPYLLFVVGWLRPQLAVIVGIIVVFASIRVLGDVARQPAAGLVRNRQDLLAVAAVALSALLWVGLSGTGGIGYQNYDLLKDNTVLKDLVSRSWPVTYAAQEGEPPHVLDYYIAIYLLPAFVGKSLGWVAANLSLFIETYVGVLMGMLWFLRAVRTRRLLAAMLIFIFASGLDIVGLMLIGTPFTLGDHIEFWAETWQYSSNTTLAFWVPQQAIVGWIVTGIIMCYSTQRAAAGSMLFIAATGILWSPTVTIGALALATATALLSARKDVRRVLTLQTTVGVLALLLPVGLMYLANAYYVDPRAADTAGGRGQFIWQYYDIAHRWPKLVLFEVLQFGLFFAAVTAARSRAHVQEWALFAAAIATLVALPVYRYGEANVFVLRTSIPALFVLWVFVTRLVLANATQRRETALRLGVGILLVVGAVAPVSEIARSFQHGGWRFEAPSFNATPDMQTGLLDGRMTREHVGDPDAWFFTHLAGGEFAASDR